MNWWLLAGSLVAVLALAGIARLLALGGPQRLGTGADAVTLAEALVSGFEGKVGIVSASGDHGAAVGGPGDLVLIEPLGARHRATRFEGARVAMVHPVDSGTALTLELAPGAIFRMTVADADEARAFAAALDPD